MSKILLLLLCLAFLQTTQGQNFPTPPSDNTTTTDVPETTTLAPTIKGLQLDVGIPLRTVFSASEPLELSIKEPLQPDHQFWIFEAHSQYYEIALTNFPPGPNGVQGFNVTNHPGIFMLRGNSSVPPKVYLSCNVDANVTVLILVRGYSSNSPVPGLDNADIRNNSEIFANPTMNLTWDKNLVRLRFPNAGYLDNKTSKSDWIFSYQVYQIYFDEHDYDENNYITRLAGFLMSNDIKSNGHLVSDGFVRPNVSWKQNEVVFGAYPGSAAIYTVIATTSRTAPNGSEISYSTVYVATSTYACNLDESLPINCKVMWLTITKVVCGISVFVGLFMALFGHRHFQITQFFFGILGGYLVGFILVEKYSTLDFTGTLGLSAGVAVLFAILWSCIWFFCGIPLLATVLPTAVMGLLLGCLLVFLPPLNIASFTMDTTYWVCVGAFTLGTPLVLLSFTQSASILSCAVIGTYAIITPIDHYIGSSLKYILVNVIRRATVPDFNYAVIYFPFQTNDIALAVGWIGLIVLSCVVQKFRERNRAPFPPNLYQQWRWRREERSSVTENATNAANELTPLLISVRGSPPPSAPVQSPSFVTPIRLSTPTRSARTPNSGQTPVVGYIEGYGAIVASPTIRAFHMPEFYEGRPTSGIATTTSLRASAPAPRRPQTQSLEDSDIFRPPDDYQNPAQ